MERDDARRSSAQLTLARVGADFHRRGWCLGTSGNLSLVLGREPLNLLVTRSGADKGALGDGDFLRVDGQGRAVPGESGRPSAEARLHAAVARRSDAGAVLHTHSVAATLLSEHFGASGALSFSGYEMLKGLRGFDSHESSLLLPVLANSQDMDALAAAVEGCFDSHPQPAAHRGFLLAGHGLYSWGTDLDEARRHLETLEFLLEIRLQRTRLEPYPD